MSDAVFHPDGDRFVPTDLARGPWDANAQHGGAPAALIARGIEQHAPGPPMLVARLTIELLRPVPLAPLTVRTRTTRPGRKVQLVEAALFAGDAEVVRASGLRIRVKDVAVPPLAGAAPPLPAGPGAGAVERFEAVSEASFGHAMEFATVAGGIDEPGPAVVWFRLRVPVVAGEETTPLQRVAAAADFGNGISAVVDWDVGWLFINPDLTVYLDRYPIGEWVALDATTHTGAQGVGMAEAALHDEHGRIGRSVQSLLLDHPSVGGPS